MSETKNEVLETVEAIISKKNDLGMLKQTICYHTSRRGDTWSSKRN